MNEIIGDLYFYEYKIFLKTPCPLGNNFFYKTKCVWCSEMRYYKKIFWKVFSRVFVKHFCKRFSCCICSVNCKLTTSLEDYFLLLFDPKVHLFENILLKMLAQLQENLYFCRRLIEKHNEARSNLATP